MKTNKAWALTVLMSWAGAATAATYYVAQDDPKAADTNPGTAELPWRTISRAGAAANELEPGDTVLIREGVYRECVDIRVSGEPDRPITFAAAPGARVVIKGSEIVTGRWTRASEDRNLPEPFPNAFQQVWKVRLDDAYFRAAGQPPALLPPAARHVTTVYLNDRTPLQLVGTPPFIDNSRYTMLEPLGRGPADLRMDSFCFDPATQTLFVKVPGEPSWYQVEIGVRPSALHVDGVHDVVVRGLEVRHSRSLSLFGSLATVGGSARVTLEDCRFTLGDFCGVGVVVSSNCVVRRCAVSWNGNTGLNLHRTVDCTVEDCTVFHNNYRRFASGWHAGGMKHIPGNIRTTIRRCEVAYNFDSAGIWFDTANQDVRILDNVCHHNATGIFHEGNWGGGVIAGNLCFANRHNGIMIADHLDNAMLRKILAGDVDPGWKELQAFIDPQGVAGADAILWVVHNTLADNVCGLTTEDRGGWQILRNVRLLNNLFLRNQLPGEKGLGFSADVTFAMHADAQDRRAVTNNHSDYNVFAAPAVLKPGYGLGNTRTFDYWKSRFGEDLHSYVLPVEFEATATGFRLLSRAGLDMAGPLPEAVTRVWKPRHPRRVGAERTAWP